MSAAGCFQAKNEWRQTSLRKITLLAEILESESGEEAPSLILLFLRSNLNTADSSVVGTRVEAKVPMRGDILFWREGTCRPVLLFRKYRIRQCNDYVCEFLFLIILVYINEDSF